MKLCVYVEPKGILLNKKKPKDQTNIPQKRVSLRNTLELQKMQKIICENFIETDSSMHEMIEKSWALGTNNQVSQRSACKYNLL